MLVEPFIGGDEPPPDYKFFVFDGRVEYIQVDVDRYVGHRRAFFDRDWNRQPFSVGYKPAREHIEAPFCLAEMIEASETLGREWPFVRIDLYEVGRKPKFGEVTFYPGSGIEQFTPRRYDRIFGDLWP